MEWRRPTSIGWLRRAGRAAKPAVWLPAADAVYSGAVLGAIIVAVIIVVVLPVTFLATGGVATALLGWALKENADATHEGSELLETNY
jgi:hypothetical protein